MPDVLGTKEIDTLLESVADSAGGAAAHAISIDGTGTAAEVNNYDFKRPKRVSKEQIRALTGIHEDFSRSFGATLSGFLRTIVDVHVVAVEQVMYSEFVNSLPNPTCFMIMQAPPLEGNMFLEISPLIVYPIIDRLLGGSGTDTIIPQRPLTSIEWRLVNRLIERAVGHLSDTWRNLVEAKFDVVDSDSNPHLVNIIAPTEVVVSITFEIKVGRTAGTMSLCIPFNAIEPVVGKLATQSWLGYKPKSATDVQQRRLLRNLQKSTIGVTVYLGETSVKLSELRGLRPGDIIPLEKRVERELLVRIEGRNKFAGAPGQLRGRRAVRLTRNASIDEPL